MSFTAARLKELLSDACTRHGVPGASLALWADGQLAEAAAGVVNLDTQVPTTADSIFQIGSITKPLTTTMAMQLVDDGTIALDAPVSQYVPEFSVQPRESVPLITVRQLMSHASGIDGDYFIETSRGESRIKEVVELAARDVALLHAPGHGFSYCNLGFVILGRLIEIADKTNFDRAFRTRIAKRIGAESLVTLPEQCLRYSTAIGHIADGKGGLRVTPVPYLAQSNGPAGSTPTGRARDLITFVRTHLALGVAPNGERVLSEGCVRAMQEPQNPLLPFMSNDAFGLSWMIADWDGTRVWGHDGVTIGQNGYLRVLPRQELALALLANGGDMRSLYTDVFTAVFHELAGVAPAGVPAVDQSVRVDAAKMTGRYGRRSATTVIGSDAKGLTISTLQHDTWAKELMGDMGPFPLQPVNETTFLAYIPGSKLPTTIVFFDHDTDGRPQALFSGVRRFNREG